MTDLLKHAACTYRRSGRTRYDLHLNEVTKEQVENGRERERERESERERKGEKGRVRERERARRRERGRERKREF